MLPENSFGMKVNLVFLCVLCVPFFFSGNLEGCGHGGGANQRSDKPGQKRKKHKSWEVVTAGWDTEVTEEHGGHRVATLPARLHRQVTKDLEPPIYTDVHGLSIFGHMKAI